MSDLSLYVDAQYASPYAMTAFVALTEKRVPFELLALDLSSGAQHAPEYARASLTHRVPTLVHQGFALSESSAIAEYVDETFPGTALYPKDPKMRARARQIQAWLRSDLMAIRQERTTEVVFLGRRAEPLSVQALTAVAQLIAAAQSLIKPGQTQLFDAWSIADTDLALMLNRLHAHGDALPSELAQFVEHQNSRPSVQAWYSKPRV
jgi:glutathione S-transferase